MKSMDTFYEELLHSGAALKAFAKASNAGEVDRYLMDLGIDATAAEFADYVRSMAMLGQLDDSELELVAGGTGTGDYVYSLVLGTTGCELKKNGLEHGEVDHSGEIVIETDVDVYLD